MGRTCTARAFAPRAAPFARKRATMIRCRSGPRYDSGGTAAVLSLSCRFSTTHDARTSRFNATSRTDLNEHGYPRASWFTRRRRNGR